MVWYSRQHAGIEFIRLLVEQSRQNHSQITQKRDAKHPVDHVPMKSRALIRLSIHLEAQVTPHRCCIYKHRVFPSGMGRPHKGSVLDPASSLDRSSTNLSDSSLSHIHIQNQNQHQH